MFSNYYDISSNGIYLRKEFDYLNSLYPGEIKELKSLVATELDKMDYPGSMIYDECPDQVMFSKKCGEICSVAKCNCKYGKKCENDNFLRDLIKVLLLNEISTRRHQHNKPEPPSFHGSCNGSCGRPPMERPNPRPPYHNHPNERPPFRPIPPEYMR